MTVRRWFARWGDLALAVVLLLVLVVELAGHDGTPPTAYAAALLCAAPLALRRRLPVVACLLAIVGMAAISLLVSSFMNTSFGMIAVLAIALYSMGRYARGVEAGIAAGVVLVVIVAFLASEQQASYEPGDIAFAVLFVGGPWAAGLVIRLRADRVRHLDDRNAELVIESTERARKAVADERSRIARELHDVVSHAIAVTVLQARGARRTLGVDDAQVGEALDVIVDTNTAALGDMRRLLALLRDTEDNGELPTDPQPSLLRLEELVDSFRRSGLRVELVLTGPVDGVPPGVGLTAYRIVQEALTNVLRHADSSATVEVRVDFEPASLRLSVSDDGGSRIGGVGSGAGSGNGLTGIRERVAVVGGTMDAGTTPEGGFVLRAALPYALGGIPTEAA